MRKIILLTGLFIVVACNTHPVNDPPLDIVDGGDDIDTSIDASSDQSVVDSDTKDASVKDAAPVPHCGDVGMIKCIVGADCRQHSDCATNVCSYKHLCLPSSEMSCAGHFGGDTCGIGETNDPAHKHVSCCETAPLFGSMSGIQMDRFLITAGRMRTFIERVNGDVLSFVHTLPSNQWNAGYDQYVPGNMVEADVQLGSYFNKKSCHAGDHTGRTYWTPPDADDFSDFTKDQLDEKALNCLTPAIARALCLWDGKRLPTGSEIRNAFTNGGQDVQPWLWKPGSYKYPQPPVYTLNIPYTNVFNHNFTYGYPAPKTRAPGLDIAYYISPPGRYPDSWNEHGHEIAGNLLTWVDDGAFVEANTFSWELHGDDGAPDSDWAAFEATDQHSPNGYYAIGARCVSDK